MSKVLRKKSILFSIIIMVIMLVNISLVPSYVFGWRTETSSIPTRPNFTTHQWLAWEAVEMFPEAQVSWITENLLAFRHGVEAPFNPAIVTDYDLNASDYGNIHDEETLLTFDATGTIVVNDSLADLAEREYDLLKIELNKNDTDFELAAFYAGSMSHYISQAGAYRTVWNATEFGEAFDTDYYNRFESAIEYGLTESRFAATVFNINFEDTTIYYNDYFTLSPTTIANAGAYDATVDLAQIIYPLAFDLQDNLNYSIVYAEDWETVYYNNVNICLTASVEAIYAALADAMIEVKWRSISIPDPIFSFNIETNLLDIPEFEVTYTEDTNTYTLNDSMTTVAELWYVYYDGNDPDMLSSDSYDLEYNGGTNRWYITNDTVAFGTAARTNHTILYRFDMDLAAPTWSNISENYFYIDYYNTTITNIDYTYNSAERTLDIENVTAVCWDLPYIDVVEPAEVTSSTWHLYQKGVGYTQTGEIIGVPMYDTEGNIVEGTLSFNAINGSTWESLDNDIGLVFTPTGVELYIVVRFALIVPVGSLVPGFIVGIYDFVPLIQDYTSKFFRTRDHNIAISTPELVYDEEAQTVSVYNITAVSDYNNTILDYWEIIEKDVYGQDIREARVKIFLWDGIASGITERLLYDDDLNYWYFENIDVSGLPDNHYYISAKISNMNINFTTSPWGPASQLFTIGSPLPFSIYLIPIVFVIAFITVPITVAIVASVQKRKMKLIISDTE